jgi:hypothetical protein
MRHLSVVACLLGSLLAACSGAPSEDTPDYEITAVRRNPTGSSGSTPTGDTPTSAIHEDETDSGTSTSSSSSGQPSANSSTVGVTVDGTKLNVDGMNIWSEVSKAGDYDLFVKVSGPGVATGSDIHVKATAVTTGCGGDNYIDFRPANAPQHMSKRGDATCGLVIDELPTAVGGRFKGTFKGTLTSINTTPATSKNFVFTFDALRAK